MLAFTTSRREFPQTRWSLVQVAGGEPSAESAAALETLCRAYWYPLYAYVRRCGHTAHDAQDLAQAFFCQLLEKGWLGMADRDRGKLRTFLIVALRHFMAKEWRRQAAERRGGACTHVPLDTDFAESRYAADPAPALSSERLFDRQWALTLLDLTLGRLREEFERAGRGGDFEQVKQCLMAARGAIDYAAVARDLGTSEGAARVTVHRLRKRFRAIYREEISRTLEDGADLEAELRHLAAALVEP
jgi:RNA polymerase sigma-70 factor (ECF subfamily)